MGEIARETGVTLERLETSTLTVPKNQDPVTLRVNQWKVLLLIYITYCYIKEK